MFTLCWWRAFHLSDMLKSLPSQNVTPSAVRKTSEYSELKNRWHGLGPGVSVRVCLWARYDELVRECVMARDVPRSGSNTA